MAHELGHSTLNLYSNFDTLRFDKTYKGVEDAIFPGTGVTVDHGAIWGLERDFLQKNGLNALPGFFDNSSKMQGVFNSMIFDNVTYRQLYEKIKNLSVKITPHTPPFLVPSTFYLESLIVLLFFH